MSAFCFGMNFFFLIIVYIIIIIIIKNEHNSVFEFSMAETITVWV